MSYPQVSRKNILLGSLTLLVVIIGGLYIVKWDPYFHKALSAASSHSIGESIVSSKGATPPAPSLAAALDYGSCPGCPFDDVYLLRSPSDGGPEEV